MKLEDQVITIEQAKKLKALGVNQDSWCHWAQNDNTGNRIELFVKGIVPFIGKSHCTENYAAFTVAELGMLLPNAFNTMRLHKFCIIDFNDFEIEHCTGEEGWKPYDEDDADPLDDDVFFDTEAQARAAMLIYLLQSGKVTADEVNQRLMQTT